MAIPLFSPDSFSKESHVLQALTAENQAIVAGVVEEHFRERIGKLETVHRVGGLAMEETDRVEGNGNNFILRSQAGSFFLKRVLNKAAVRSLPRQLDLMAWLHRRGLPVPCPLPTDSGHHSLHDGRTRWCLMPLLPGTHFRGTPEELEQAGHMVGSLFHQLSEAPEGLRIGHRRDYFLGLEDKRFSAMVIARPYWEQFFPAEECEALESSWAKVEEIYREVKDREPDYRELPSQFSHFDLHPHNVLVQNGLVTGILDFDAVGMMPAGIAQGFALQKLSRQAVVCSRQRGANGSPGGVAARFQGPLVKAFKEGAYEMEHLAALAKIEILRRFLSVCSMRLQGRAFVFSGPLVHLAAMFEVDVLCS